MTKTKYWMLHKGNKNRKPVRQMLPLSIHSCTHFLKLDFWHSFWEKWLNWQKKLSLRDLSVDLGFFLISIVSICNLKILTHNINPRGIDLSSGGIKYLFHSYQWKIYEVQFKKKEWKHSYLCSFQLSIH